MKTTKTLRRFNAAFCWCCGASGETGLVPVGEDASGEINFRCTACGNEESARTAAGHAAKAQRSADAMRRMTRSLGLAMRPVAAIA